MLEWENNGRGTIFKRMWNHLDFKAGMLRLRSEDNKIQERRLIPLTKELTRLCKTFTIYRAQDGQCMSFVFSYHGKPIKAICRAFETACRQAGITGVVFHDPRPRL